MTKKEFILQYAEAAGDKFFNELDCKFCPLEKICGDDAESGMDITNCSEYIKSKLTD